MATFSCEGVLRFLLFNGLQLQFCAYFSYGTQRVLLRFMQFCVLSKYKSQAEISFLFPFVFISSSFFQFLSLDSSGYASCTTFILIFSFSHLIFRFCFFICRYLNIQFYLYPSSAVYDGILNISFCQQHNHSIHLQYMMVYKIFFSVSQLTQPTMSFENLVVIKVTLEDVTFAERVSSLFWFSAKKKVDKSSIKNIPVGQI